MWTTIFNMLPDVSGVLLAAVGVALVVAPEMVSKLPTWLRRTLALLLMILGVAGLRSSYVQHRDDAIEKGASKKELEDMTKKLSDLPNSQQIADDLHAMEQNPTPIVAEAVPQPKPKAPTSSSRIRPKTPPPQLVVQPATQPPQRGTLRVSQSPEPSTRAEAPYRIKVVIQTDIGFPSLKLLLKCDQPILEAKGEIQGGQMRMLTGDGVVHSDPTLWALYYASATPTFGPANPISVDVYAAHPISCKQASTY